METTIANKRMLEVSTDLFVGTYDIDFAGHVSNIVYLRWFEQLRLLIFEKYCPLQKVMEDGFLPIITSHYVEYKLAVNLFDKPKGYMWIEEVDGIRIKFKGEIRVNDKVATAAEHKGVFVSAKSMKPTRIPPDILRLCKDHSPNE